MIHQHRVFIDFLLFNLDETLADRLDIADARIKLLHGGQKSKRGCGFAVILTGCADKDARGYGIHLFVWSVIARSSTGEGLATQARPHPSLSHRMGEEEFLRVVSQIASFIKTSKRWSKSVFDPRQSVVPVTP